MTKIKHIDDGRFTEREVRHAQQLKSSLGLMGVLVGIAVLCFAYSQYQTYLSNVPKPVPCVGYTVINYDSVEWCDGTKRKYNWHVKHTHK